MKTMSLLAAVLALGLTFGVGDADAAKRLGGGKSAGMQREMTVGKTPGATPAQTPTAPMAATTPAQGAMAAAPAAAQSKRSWMGPLAGIAAGIGLAALASHFGFGDELASMMMIGLLAMLAVAVIGFIMRRRAAARHPALAVAGADAGAGGMFRSTQAEAPASRGFEVSMPPASPAATPTAGASTGTSLFGSSFGASPAPTSAIGAGLAAAPVIPAGFDVEAFVRNAKANFIRLQAANDSANLDELREVTTPEMFAELKTDIVERGAAAQQTEVLTIGADVLEVIEDAARYVVSVRFTGQIREDRFAASEAFDEVWHLTKSRTGSGGWLLSGIQQAQ
ncbi:MAG: hypothetical protein RLZZ22_1057 [Pseudomonadota bacterium]|jgi:predicted lipid-binding transport protein (Tim44 family)